ncbi:MAG: ATP-binding cassette domain-containing protein [Candidatus Dormibacteraceae bacterium]
MTPGAASWRPVPWPLLLAAALMFGYLVAPVLALLAALPSSRPGSYVAATGGLGTSVAAATLATTADGLLGIPLGLWLARTRSRWRHPVTAGVLVPLAFPPVVSGLVLVLLLGPGGGPGSLLDRAGLDPLNTLAGTVLAQMFVAAPFVVISARAAFAGVDRGIEDAARTLGAGPGQTFRRVLVPAARRGLATGLVLGWLRCLGEFGATAIVAYHPYTLPVLTYVRLTGEGLQPALAGAALLAVVGAAAAALLLRLDWLAPRPPAREEKGGAGAFTAALSGRPRLAPARLRVRSTLRLGSFRLEAAFDAGPGVVALLGRSGAGKSLTLGTVAGLVRPTTGLVEIGGTTVLDTAAGVDLPPERRHLGYVAQRDALFEHLDVERNIGFAARGSEPAEMSTLVRALGIERVRHARPATLSGGERQRVALGRALASRPRALLLDEPFSALDPPVRRELRRLVREVHEVSGLPILLVTHDREDVLDLADQVVVLEAGHVVQAGSVDDVFARPACRAVAELVGAVNVLPVERTDQAPATGPRSSPLPPGRVRVVTSWGAWILPENGAAGAGPWELAVPVEAARVDLGGGPARVRRSRPRPGGWLVEVERDGGHLEGVAEAGRRPRPGEPCALRVDGERCHLMPVSGGLGAAAGSAPEGGGRC